MFLPLQTGSGAARQPRWKRLLREEVGGLSRDEGLPAFPWRGGPESLREAWKLGSSLAPGQLSVYWPFLGSSRKRRRSHVLYLDLLLGQLCQGARSVCPSFRAQPQRTAGPLCGQTESQGAHKTAFRSQGVETGPESRQAPSPGLGKRPGHWVKIGPGNCRGDWPTGTLTRTTEGDWNL